MSSEPARRGWNPRRVLLPALALGIGVVAALLIAEGVFRLLGFKAESPGRIFRITDGADVHYPGRAGHSVIDLYVSNPRGTFPVDLEDAATRDRLKRAGFSRIDEARKTNPWGMPFRYNSRGFRDREFTPKPPGVRRVVLVGDSFTEAQGVAEDRTAARLMESLLRSSEPSIEVWNLGVRGHDFPALEALFDIALELDPDLLLFEMVLNDGDRNPELMENWPRINDWIMVRETAPSWIETRSYLASFLAHRYERMRVSWDTTAWYRALYSDGNREGWGRTRAALGRIQKKCRERGAVFAVALWPLIVGLETPDAYPFGSAHAQIQRGVLRSGIPFLDLLPTLQGRRSDTLWVHPSDLHPNEEAQALVAPVLAKFASERLEEAARARSVAK